MWFSLENIFFVKNIGLHEIFARHSGNFFAQCQKQWRLSSILVGFLKIHRKFLILKYRILIKYNSLYAFSSALKSHNLYLLIGLTRLPKRHRSDLLRLEFFIIGRLTIDIFSRNLDKKRRDWPKNTKRMGPIEGAWISNRENSCDKRPCPRGPDGTHLLSILSCCFWTESALLVPQHASTGI
jgi:hypothetical protein